MQFTKLRLVGFKSFVDSTELDIDPGVTGIVGPNGCGKSNLVEGLRWVMGETSAKKMRGSEMDDVIFGGTSGRPARNIAEAALVLDNSDRVAPAQFNDLTQIEVVRKIEREKGSNYKVNARDVRARDVQLLFADAASGARSTALVSQGHVGEVIAAKPTDRRKLLEEAAGITGLHSRRHEAELRLRGAETNLERLDDILVTLEAQMQSLKKQLRQARRYRSLNDHIRKAEAAVLLIRWQSTREALTQAESAFAEADTVVAARAAEAAQAGTIQADAATGLPKLRQAEAEAAAALQRLNLAQENLQAEEARLEGLLKDCQLRAEQTDVDMARESRLAEDAGEALTRLQAERESILVEKEAHQTAWAEAEERLKEARGAAESCEERLRVLTDEVAHTNARQVNLQDQRESMTSRMSRLASMREEISTELESLNAESGAAQEIERLEAERDRAAETLQQSRDGATAASTTRTEATGRLAEANSISQAASAATARLEAEVAALSNMLGTDDPDLWPPMIDALTVTPGYEQALGAALGDDLTAATDEAAPIHWRTLPPLATTSSLPTGAEPLDRFVQAPPALMRRLSQIGVVSDGMVGAQLIAQLLPGQRLVSRDGALWRWDGFAATSDAATPAAKRLEQRNRLDELTDELKAAQVKSTQADADLDAARNAADLATERDEAARKSVTDAENQLSESREREAALRQKFAESNSRQQAITEALTRVTADLDEAQNALTAAEAELAGLPALDAKKVQINEFGGELSDKRADFVSAQSTFDLVRRRAEERDVRLKAIEQEVAGWTTRRDESTGQHQALSERREQLKAEAVRLAERPQELADQRSDLETQLEIAETKRQTAADELAVAETTLRNADGALRDAEAALATVRENRVRAEASVAQAKQLADGLVERVRERLEAAPEELRDIAGLAEDAELPPEDGAERRLERLLRERENMGPVNLRAEAEAEELDEKIQTLESERGDLIKAIEKLRRGIAELNREGRARLLASFEEVDKHFQELFVRLFGGGRAHLALTEADDPLEAGLEIMASPPGKRLQVLSLLSGGEQALTALSLLFAVFLTNPAPICVLDEVDAPLDDANVDRFCSLVEEMARTGQTRFLVITHHRMTMARVDRLYGVTMGEQGVSQLVSVDLRQAEQLRATA